MQYLKGKILYIYIFFFSHTYDILLLAINVINFVEFLSVFRIYIMYTFYKLYKNFKIAAVMPCTTSLWRFRKQCPIQI